MARPDLQTSGRLARLLSGTLIAAVVATALALLRGTYALESLEWRLVDARTRAYVGTRPPDPDIVLASIDGGDIDALKEVGYPWPWPLDITAKAFHWMAEAGVRAVVVDVLQFDKGMGPEELERDGRTLTPDQREAATLEGKSADVLADAYRCIGDVTLAYLLLSAGDTPPPGSTARRPVFDEHMERLPRLDLDPVLRRARPGMPVLRLLRGARDVGYANMLADGDGIIRRAHPVAWLGERVVPSLALAAVMLQRQGASASRGEIRLGATTQRLDEEGAFFTNFRGPGDSYARVRCSDLVLAGGEFEVWEEGGRQGPLPTVGSAQPEAVRGKIVVWGVNAAGLKDVVSSPISGSFPGPEYQATMIDNLLHGDGRVLVSGWLRLVLLFGSTLLVGALGRLLPLGAYAGVVVAVLAAGWIPGFLLFASGIVLDLVTPSAAVVLTALGVVGLDVITEGRRNRWLEGTFGKYLSPNVIEALKHDPSLIALGGRKTEISVLFSDIKGFTSISERLEPSQLVALLNRYLTRQSAEVLVEDGVVDKFIGDAVMAFFGDPIPQPDHALRACRSAVRSQRALEDLQPFARELGLSGIANRIGVNSGPAHVGNFGSAERFSYTAMGDSVNFSSRLEGANKAFGTKILIGEATYLQAKEGILAKPVARLRVVGKTEPVAVYELVGLAEDGDETMRRHVEAYVRAHDLVRADDLEGARAAISQAEEIKPRDALCSWLRGIVADLAEGRTPRPWDGTLTLETKG